MVTKKALVICCAQALERTLKSAWDSMMGSMLYAIPSTGILVELFRRTFALYFSRNLDDPTTVSEWHALHLVSCLSETASLTALELALANITLAATCEHGAKADALAQDLTNRLDKQVSLLPPLKVAWKNLVLRVRLLSCCHGPGPKPSVLAVAQTRGDLEEMT